MSWLGIDVGTSSVKAGLITEDGRLLTIARRNVSIIRGEGANEYEADSDEWTAAAISAIREATAGRPPPLAFAISGNGPTLVALDKSDRPVGPALSWMDRRAASEAAMVSHNAGMPIDASFYLPKALWFIRNHPEAERITRFLSCPEHLLFVLTGEAWTCLPDAGYLPYIWNDALIEAVGLSPALFPPFIGPGRLAGSLRRSAAEELGLPPGIPAAMGFPDFLAGLVGAGVVEPGQAGDRGGTSEAINIAARNPFPGRGLLSLPHAIPGLWNLSGGLSTAGKALEWLASNLGLAGPEELGRAAQRAPAGARGLFFLPYLAGERAPLWDPDRRASFVGMALGQGRDDMARAAFEALSYALRLPAELALNAGFAISSIRTTGGTGRSDFLCGLKAAVLNIAIEVPEVPDSELVGDAAAAAVALGEHPDLASASRAMARVARRHEPDPRLKSLYDENFGLWKEALGALAHVDARIAAALASRGSEN